MCKLAAGPEALAAACAIRIVFAITREFEVKIAIYRPSAAPYVRVFLVCPPTHPGMGFSRTGVLGPAGAGSGGRMQAGGCLCLTAPVRAPIGF